MASLLELPSLREVRPGRQAAAYQQRRYAGDSLAIFGRYVRAKIRQSSREKAFNENSAESLQKVQKVFVKEEREGLQLVVFDERSFQRADSRRFTKIQKGSPKSSTPKHSKICSDRQT